MRRGRGHVSGELRDPLSLVPPLRDEGPAKATQPVSDKTGIRIQASGAFPWLLGSGGETSKQGRSSRVVGLLGYFCSFAGAGMRPSCKSSSKTTQERKESPEKTEGNWGRGEGGRNHGLTHFHPARLTFSQVTFEEHSRNMLNCLWQSFKSKLKGLVSDI